MGERRPGGLCYGDGENSGNEGQREPITRLSLCERRQLKQPGPLQIGFDVPIGPVVASIFDDVAGGAQPVERRRNAFRQHLLEIRLRQWPLVLVEQRIVQRRLLGQLDRDAAESPGAPLSAASLPEPGAGAPSMRRSRRPANMANARSLSLDHGDQQAEKERGRGAADDAGEAADPAIRPIQPHEVGTALFLAMQSVANAENR